MSDNWNPPGEQRPSRFKVLLWLFITFAIIIFLFAILSQPLAMITNALGGGYPSGGTFDVGRGYNTGLQSFVVLALGAAVVVGLIFLFIFYGFKNLGGGGKDSFG